VRFLLEGADYQDGEGEIFSDEGGNTMPSSLAI
jgi:hypothetical protein